MKELKFNERMARRLQMKQNVKKMIIWKAWFKFIEVINLYNKILVRYDVSTIFIK